jgi:exopolyphosphatase / guanosine-5'-triphosphate,3'-diphosphate pyrophosphatase
VRVAVVDIGTNSTRLFIADVGDDGALEERHRESIVTRLGARVDATGRLQDDAMQRVFDTLARFRELIDEHGATATTAVLTSAVRDAANGPQFAGVVRERYGLDARTIPGAEEAELTFLGATSEREGDTAEIAVVDIGGGSTEVVVGHGREVAFFVSMQAGVVRQTERHLHHDPPERAEVDALAEEVAGIIDREVPAEVRERVTAIVAVAGTATSTAAIDLGLEPYDPTLVHGHVLETAAIDRELARMASLTNDERREVPGLHPDRAPTIVAGMALLRACVRAFGVDRVEVSEHDILRGAALRLDAP